MGGGGMRRAGGRLGRPEGWLWEVWLKERNACKGNEKKGENW
jgi:hypothetical protein